MKYILASVGKRAFVKLFYNVMAQFVISVNLMKLSGRNKNKEWLKNRSLLLAVKRNILHFGTSHKLAASVALNVPTERQCST